MRKPSAIQFALVANYVLLGIMGIGGIGILVALVGSQLIDQAPAKGGIAVVIALLIVIMMPLMNIIMIHLRKLVPTIVFTLLTSILTIGSLIFPILLVVSLVMILSSQECKNYFKRTEAMDSNQ